MLLSTYVEQTAVPMNHRRDTDYRNAVGAWASGSNSKVDFGRHKLSPDVRGISLQINNSIVATHSKMTLKATATAFFV